MRPIFGQPNLLKPLCHIDLVDGALAITSPYDAAFVAALKATIPASDRKWDSTRKQWMVSVDFGSQVAGLIQQHCGVAVSLPKAPDAPTRDEMRLLDVRYLGACKTREDGQETAFAWASGEWSVIVPKPALLEWFGQTARPDEAQTYYGVLGVTQQVTAAELKAAWKRMARTWHPDISKEPGSAEQFRTIQQAYEVLSNANMRAKYNAGLALEAMSKAHSKHSDYQAVSQSEYRAPLRCGLILANGQARLGRFVVSKILQWQDIVNSRGEVLVTTWGMGDKHFTEHWTMP